MSLPFDFGSVVVLDQTLHVGKFTRHERAVAAVDLDFFRRHLDDFSVHDNAIGKLDTFDVLNGRKRRRQTEEQNRCNRRRKDRNAF